MAPRLGGSYKGRKRLWAVRAAVTTSQARVTRFIEAMSQMSRSGAAWGRGRIPSEVIGD